MLRSIIKNVTIEESPLADIGVEVDNENLCSPDDAIIFLTDDTYLNPDTTSYLISIYAGEDNLIGTYNFIQSSLPDQSEGVLLDELIQVHVISFMMILHSMVLIKFRLRPLIYVIHHHQYFLNFIMLSLQLLSFQLIVLINVQVDGTHLQ